MSKRDVLLFGLSESEEYAALLEWAKEVPEMQEVYPDFHRMVLERWLWEHRDIGGRIMDVGQPENPRRYFGDGYFTFGPPGCDQEGDLLDLPFKDGELDGAIVAEVLEHCADPKGAVAEVRRVVKPGGLTLWSSPFIWPWHGTEDYPDYWRFTDQGWKLLLQKFVDVKVKSVRWTKEGSMLYDLLRRFECFGFREQTHASTGYLCEAVK